MSQQLAKTNDLKRILSSENMKEQFGKALPAHLKPERFIRCSITALTRTPKLADCTQESFMKCLLDLSSFGLEPDGRRAHLIPYGNQCTLIIDWKGLAELAMRSGIIAKLHADVVCENDAFAYNMGEVTQHEIDWKQPRGAMYAAYAMAQTKTGEKFFAVMSKEEIDGIRQRSRSGSSGPWQTDYMEMAKKSCFRRLSKWLPLSAEFRDAVEREDDDNGIRPERDITPTTESSKLYQAPVLPPVSTAEEVGLPGLINQVDDLLGNAGLVWEDVKEYLENNHVIGDNVDSPTLLSAAEAQDIIRNINRIAEAVNKTK